MQTILVCDDDKQIVEAIDIYLTGEGFQVIKAYDGYEALELLESHSIDLMIVDVMMPGLDGIRTTLKVRETSSIPIIILSAKEIRRSLCFLSLYCLELAESRNSKVCLLDCLLDMDTHHSRTRKQILSPSGLFTDILPPWASAMAWAIDRPIPVPPKWTDRDWSIR